MKKILFAGLFFLIVLSGLAFAQDESSSGPGNIPGQVNEWLNKNNLTVTNTQDDAFVNNYILVYAEGLPSAAASSPAQRRLTAERAAEVLAYRKLAEFLDGVAVVGDSVVKDDALQYDVVRSAVVGFVRGAQVVYEKYDDQEGSAIAIVKIGMMGPEGFGRTMYQKLLGNPDVKKGIMETNAPQYRRKPAHLDEAYDGLIIDATDQDFRPALINRIFTTKGDVLYDPSKVSQKILVEDGCGEYTNSVDKAKAALASRGVNNPLIVKAVGTVSAADLQVSDDDAVKIYSANQKGNFFAGAKVAFVLK